MNAVKLQNIQDLHLLWLLPPLVAAHIYAWHKRRKALAVFVDIGLHDKISMSVSHAKRTWKAILLLTAIALTIVAMTRPGWNPRPETIERSGRDVVFLLDVSRSMLAEDLVPNRLERAKLAIKDCVERLDGDRVGIVVFSGTAAVKCPLTLDYGFFRMMLDGISTDSIARGGTMIGDAIRKIMNDVFDSQDKEFKDIILITDGEDHDSFPVEAAKNAGEKGVRIIAIGLGDENEGRRIPVINDGGQRAFLTYKGQEVWTKLDADMLRKMVNATPGGRYLNVATGTIDLGNVYTALIRSAEKKKLESDTIKRYEEKFQIFLVLALILILSEMMMNERRQRPRQKSSGPTALAVAISLLLVPVQAQAGSSERLVDKGNTAFAMEAYDEALEAYEEAAVDLPESAHIYFNKGAAYYRMADFGKATDAFEQAALKSKSSDLESKSRFNLGLCSFREAQRQQDSNLDKALEACGRSVRHFQEALELDPDFRGAAENIEVVRLTMKSILDEIKKKQEDARKQQEEMKRIADQIKKLIETQQDLLDRNASLSEEKQQRGDSPDLKDKTSDLAEDQSNLSQETEDTAEGLPSHQQPADPTQASSDPVKTHLGNAAVEQEMASGKLAKHLTTSAEYNQQQALDQLNKALESLGKDQNQNTEDGQKGDKNGQKAAQQPDAENGDERDEPKENQKAQMAQLPDDAEQILDEEKKNKNKRRAHQEGGFADVDKDW